MALVFESRVYSVSSHLQGSLLGYVSGLRFWVRCWVTIRFLGYVSGYVSGLRLGDTFLLLLIKIDTDLTLLKNCVKMKSANNIS